MKYTPEEKQEILNDQKQMYALVEKYGKEDVLKYINSKLNEDEEDVPVEEPMEEPVEEPVEEPLEFTRPVKNEKQKQMMQDVRRFANAVKVAMDEDHYACTKEAAKVIVNIVKKASTIEKTFIPEEVDKTMICTMSEAVLMLVCMLLDDEYGPDSIQYIGYRNYRGNNNPYDYSWFEEEIEDEDSDYYGKDILDFFQTLYGENRDFALYFNNVYYAIQEV